MHVFWVHDGKMICIIAMIFFPIGLLGIFTTTDPLQSAALASILTVYAFLTIKGAEGWAVRRYWNKQRKERMKFNHLK